MQVSGVNPRPELPDSTRRTSATPLLETRYVIVNVIVNAKGRRKEFESGATISFASRFNGRKICNFFAVFLGRIIDY